MSVKVVINTCYGGFGLSLAARDWLAAAGLPEAVESKATDPEAPYSFRPYVARHHPLLVACVEALGAGANGSCSSLAVESIEGNRYRIHEYDGSESIETPETLDWITVE